VGIPDIHSRNIIKIGRKDTWTEHNSFKAGLAGIFNENSNKSSSYLIIYLLFIIYNLKVIS
jgi:hypothetical protein